MELENTAALLTGCSRGIGRAIALRLARDGFHVLANDLPRQNAEIADLIAEIEADGGRCTSVPGDVGDPEDITRFVGEAIEAAGNIRVLVNNAGVLSMRDIDEISSEEWDRMYRVNTRGTFLVSQAMLRHLRTQEGARIINIASIGGKLGAPGLNHYCSSKAAVISFTQILAREVAHDGINVNAICPGIIDTEMGKNNYPDEASLQAVLDKTAMGRLGYPEDVAGPVSFLASEDSGFITGQSINVCGGIIVH